MRTLAVVVPPGARHAGIGAVLDLCDMANHYAAALYEGLDPTLALGVKLISLDGGPVAAADGRQIPIDAALASEPLYDGVFLASTAEPADGDRLAPVCAWLADQHRRGAWTAGAGAAVFLLARAGLLAQG